MSIVQKTMSSTIAVLVLCSSPATMAAEPWDEALKLREGALQAQRAGELAVAARSFADAYQAAPESCSSRTLMLLSETVEAALKASAKTAGDSLCGVEGLIEAATANPACTANLPDLATLMTELKQARRRSGHECAAAPSVAREPTEEVPLTVEVAAPAPVPRPLIEPPKPIIKAQDDPRDPRRRRFIAAGGALLGLGVGASITALVGMVRGASLEQQAEGKLRAGYQGCQLAAGLSGACADLAHDGERMNAMAIGAGIAAASLVLTGAVLMATGARPRRGVRRGSVAMQGPTFILRF